MTLKELVEKLKGRDPDSDVTADDLVDGDNNNQDKPVENDNQENAQEKPAEDSNQDKPADPIIVDDSGDSDKSAVDVLLAKQQELVQPVEKYWVQLHTL